MPLRRFRFLALFAGAFLFPALAQNVHITSSQGKVMVLRGDGAEMVGRSLQSTLVTEDRIVTAEKSQAEVQVDLSNTLQVNPDSEIKVGEVYPGRYQMIVARGGLTWRVWDGSTADAEVRTPSVGARTRELGIYSIGLNGRGETEIAAIEGNIEVFAPAGSQWVSAGQKLVARGPASDPEFRMITGPSRWRKFLSLVSRMDIGSVVSAATSGAGNGAARRPAAASAANPAHSGNTRVKTPESGHPPASGHSHTPAPSSGHSAAPAASHSTSASSSTTSASHSK